MPVLLFLFIYFILIILALLSAVFLDIVSHLGELILIFIISIPLGLGCWFCFMCLIKKEYRQLVKDIYQELSKKYNLNILKYIFIVICIGFLSYGVYKLYFNQTIEGKAVNEFENEYFYYEHKEENIIYKDKTLCIFEAHAYFEKQHDNVYLIIYAILKNGEVYYKKLYEGDKEYIFIKNQAIKGMHNNGENSDFHKYIVKWINRDIKSGYGIIKDDKDEP